MEQAFQKKTLYAMSHIERLSENYPKIQKVKKY